MELVLRGLVLTKWVLQVDNMSYSKIRSTQKANLLIEQRYLIEQLSSNNDEDFLNWVKTQEISVYFYPNPLTKSANEIGLGIIINSNGNEPPTNRYYDYISDSIKGFRIELPDNKKIYTTIIEKSTSNHFFRHDLLFNNLVKTGKTSNGYVIYRNFERGSDLFNALEKLKPKTTVYIYFEPAEKGLIAGKEIGFYPFKVKNTAKIFIE